MANQTAMVVRDGNNQLQTVSTVDALLQKQPALNGDGGSLAHVTNFPATQAITAQALPLPTGAAQENGGNLAALVNGQGADGAGISPPTGGSGIRGWLSGLYKLLSGTIITSEPSIGSAASITPNDSGTVTPGRQFLINCTASGNVKVGFPDSSTLTIPVNTGLTIMPWKVMQVFATGTTATATYANLT